MHLCVCARVYTHPEKREKKRNGVYVYSLLNGSMFSFFESHSYTLKRVVEGLLAELPWLLV